MTRHPTGDGLYADDDAEALVVGLGLLAAGGGGTVGRGLRYLSDLLADGMAVRWVPLRQLPSDALTCSVFGMGSIAPRPPLGPDQRIRFGVDEVGQRVPRPWVRAVEELERFVGRRIEGIIPFELGPSNTIVAVDAAVRTGRVLIDGDFAGRALPELSQALPAVRGLSVWPLQVCDPWGNSVIIKECPSPAVAERIGKAISTVTKAVDHAASCSHAGFVNPAGRVQGAAIPGTLSRSLEMGRAVIRARKAGADPVTAATDAGEGWLLFEGVVSNRDWVDSPEGYMQGTTGIEGTGRFTSSRAKVWFLNENHVSWVDDRVVAASPDIITVVDAESAVPISNAELEEGREVCVLGFAAAQPYRAGPALEATSPRHYGLDIDWMPIEELNPTPTR